MSAGLQKYYRTDFHKTWMEAGYWPRIDPINFLSFLLISKCLKLRLKVSTENFHQENSLLVSNSVQTSVYSNKTSNTYLNQKSFKVFLDAWSQLVLIWAAIKFQFSHLKSYKIRFRLHASQCTYATPAVEGENTVKKMTGQQ